MISAIEPAKKGNARFLVLISLVSAMGGLLFGYETVVIAGTISLVKTQFELSAAMEGWFVSSGLVGCVLGVFAAGRLSDRYGRKTILVLAGSLLALSSIGCCFSSNITWLIVFRIIGGLGVGLTSIVSPLYISEVSLPHLRGRLVSLFQLSLTFGIVAAMLINAGLLAYAVNSPGIQSVSMLHWLIAEEVWRGMFLLQALPAILFFIFSLLIPDSPRWLITRGRSNEAFNVLLKLRAADPVAKEEFESISNSVSQEHGSLTQLFQPGLRKALFIGTFLAVFSELSGITIVMYYGPVILENAGFSISHSLSGHAIIGVVLALCTLLAVWLVDKYGRRKLLLTGIAGAFLALSMLGIFFLSGTTGGYLVVILLCTFVAFFAFSLGPIKWIIISEIFPTRIRGRAMSIATMALWVTDVLINQFFPVVRDEFGIAAMFIGCSVFLIIHFYVALKKLPETKGMSLENISTLWTDKKNVQEQHSSV